MMPAARLEARIAHDTSRQNMTTTNPDYAVLVYLLTRPRKGRARADAY